MSEKTFNERFLNLIKNLKAAKNQRNKFGNYNYRSAEDILEAVKPLAVENGLIPNLTDEVVLIGDRYYVKAKATITDGVNTVESIGYARESVSKKGMDESQITGTASSYARKYAMNGLYLIDDSKDADTDEYRNQNNNGGQQKIKLINSKQLAELKELARQVAAVAEAKPSTITDRLVEMASIPTIEEMPENYVEAAMKQLNNWKLQYENKAK